MEKKIKELLDLDIIEPVNGPTPWVNAAVIVPKANGDDIRLCIEMKCMNEAIIHGQCGSSIYALLQTFSF